MSGSVALLADLIHNFGDVLTAVPLGIAFFLRSFRGEKLAGLAVVLAIFVSACVALYETNPALLGVVASAIVVSLGAQVEDPIVGLALTLVILKITWESCRTVSTTDPGDMIEPRQ